MPVSSTTLANDQGKFIQDKLIARSELMHRFPQFCEKVALPNGMGKTAEFIKYNRTDVPVDKLTEGTTPSETAFTISRQTVTVDQWGMFITLTDVAKVTTKHPVLNEALNLVGDAMARCKDYGIAEVLNDGTNVQYWDGTRATRGAVTATDVFKKEVFNKARTTLLDAGSPPRSGEFYAAVLGPQVEADIINEASAVGSLAAAVSGGGNIDPLIKGKVMRWLGFDIIRTNFIPKFTRISTFSAPTATTGGSLSGTVYHKVTRKSLSRGFEEDIQVEASTAMGGNNRLAFTAPSTAGYVYNIYAGSATGDANLFLAKENLAASGVYNLDSLPTSGDTAPATPAASVTVHPIYCFAEAAVDDVLLNEMAMDAGITPQERSDSDPLGQRRKVGAKYMSKSGIRDQNRMLRIELASTF